ncbi:MAG: hypothetical protein QOC87_2105 [Actinomycetota bacterium]|nr:hypothetical protein [Actinomycetota bacterium]
MTFSRKLDRSVAAIVVVIAVIAGFSLAGGDAAASQSRVTATVVRLNDSRTFASSYWTPARMRSAPSRTLVALEGRGPRSQTPGAASEPATLAAFRSSSTASGAAATASAVDPALYTTAPYSTSGRIFGTDAAGSFSCSGTAVNSANRSVVWTAGHCVIDPSTGYRATTLIFVPAYHSGSQPFGVWTAAEADVPPQWSQANGFPEGHDMAALVMSQNSSGQRLTDVVGGRDIEFNQSQQQDFDAFGYPAATPFNGSAMYHCLSSVVTTDPYTSPASLGISCDMNNGSSGGGWIVGSRYLNSNVTYFYKNSPGTLYGPYFGSGAASLFDQAATSTAPGTLPSGSPSPHPTTSPPPDTTGPLVSNVFAKPATFSPNGDGHADQAKLNWTQSETANVALTIKDSRGRTVVKMVSRSPLSPAGWYAKWDGRNAAGKLQKPGLYKFKIVATDLAGNASSPAAATVRIAN